MKIRNEDMSKNTLEKELAVIPRLDIMSRLV